MIALACFPINCGAAVPLVTHAPYKVPLRYYSTYMYSTYLFVPPTDGACFDVAAACYSHRCTSVWSASSSFRAMGKTVVYGQMYSRDLQWVSSVVN